jgi:hypothetical protein
MRWHLCIVFAFLCLPSFSQTVSWSTNLQENKKTGYKLILGANDNGDFYMLSSNISLESDRDKEGFRNRIYLLSLFSADLRLNWEKELHSFSPDGHITDVKILNGKVIVTSYILNKKSKYVSFYTQYVTEEGKWGGEPALLDSFMTSDIDNDNKPKLIFSHDQSLIAFSYRMINTASQGQSFHVVVLDTALNVKYRKEINVDMPAGLFTPLNSVLTDRGSFFILGIHYTTEKRIKAPGQSFFELYGYNAPLDRPVNTQIKSSSYFLTDVGVSTDNVNNSIIVAGFYSEKSQYSTAGVFYYSLTEDSLKENHSINTPFSVQYLQKFMGDKKENRELVNFSIDRLFVRKDGGVGIIAESVYQTTRSYFDYYMQSFVSHYYFHFGNIMVLSVNPDGKILWNNVITKDQNSVDDDGYFSSYTCAVTSGRLAAIYNKYVEDNSSVLITFVDPTGAQKTNVLFNDLERVTIIPRSAKQIDEETILVPAYRENKFKIAKITF